MGMQLSPTISKWTVKEVVFQSLSKYGARNVEIGTFYDTYEDILSVVRGYPLVDYRYIVSPIEDLPAGGLVPISSTSKEMDLRISIGVKSAI
jgi:hypothetical protein